jgi:hypothetical protein
MAEIVGESGRVVAVDRSRRFLEVVESRGFPQIETHEAFVASESEPNALMVTPTPRNHCT